MSEYLMRTIYLRGRSHAHANHPRQFLLPVVVLATLCLLLAPTPALAATNITVDSSDSSITYTGTWEPLQDNLDFGGSHMVTGDPTGTAVFTFSGTAIYFLSPLWPFALTTGISLDGDPPDTIFLQDPASVGAPDPDGGETVANAVVWSRTGLLDTQHTLTVSVVPAADGSQSFAVVDALTYTSDSALTPSTPSTPTTSAVILSIISSQQPTSTPTSAASSGGTHQNKTGLSIALGIVCTVFGLLVLYALRWLWRRRARRLAEEANAVPPEMTEAGGAGIQTTANGTPRRGGVYASIRTRSQKQLAAAAAAAAAMEEEEEREREREKERERRRRRSARGPSGLRHSTVAADGDEEPAEGEGEAEGSSSDADAGSESPSRSRRRSSQNSVRRKLSAGASETMLRTILERRESYAAAQDVPPWREVDADALFPGPSSVPSSRTSQNLSGQQRTLRTS